MKIPADTPQQLLLALQLQLQRERNSVAAAQRRLLISTPAEQIAVLRTYDDIVLMLRSVEVVPLKE